MTNLRVLVVDDDQAMREVLSEGLRRKGFDVVTASNVTEALGCISRDPFDALLTDLYLPDPGNGDGLTLAGAMRHTHPQAVTLIQTGYPILPEATDAILLQADDLLAKPTGIRPVVEAIRNRLANPRPGARVRQEDAPAIPSVTRTFTNVDTARAPIQPRGLDWLSSSHGSPAHPAIRDCGLRARRHGTRGVVRHP